MKLPIIPLAAFLTPLLPLSGSAALVWADHGSSSNHLYKSSFYMGLYEEPFVERGAFEDSGSITSTYTSTNGYWWDSGYRNGGSRFWSRPGYTPAPMMVTGSPYSIPSAPANSILGASGGYNSKITTTSDFSAMKGGTLPVGSWLYFAFEDTRGGDAPIGDAILSITATQAWSDAIWIPGTGGTAPALVSSTGTQLTFQGSGAVWIRTAVPLSSLMWSANDPTPYLDSDTGRFTGIEVSYGVVANIPEPSGAVSALLAGSCLVIGGRRRNRAGV